MPLDQIQTSERLVFDGALGLFTATVLAGAFALAAAWLLWRDRHRLGVGWAVTSWGLRMVAVGAALWMAIGPMQESVEQSTKAQSITLLADISQSMETIDPSDPSSAVRWKLALDTNEEPSVLALCDRARIAAGVASFECKKTQQQLAEHRPLRQLEAALKQARAALNRAQQHGEQIAIRLSGQGEDWEERVSRIESQLAGPIAEALEALEAALAAPNEAVVSQIAASLEILSENIAGVRRRFDSLARDLNEELVETQAANDQNNGQNIEELTRRERVGQVLDVLEQNVLTGLAGEVQIRRFHFDQKLQPFPANNGWEAATHVDADSNAPAAAPGRGTNLSAALMQLAEDRSTESTRFAILFTDGHHNDPDAPAPQDVAIDLTGLPVYIVPVGNVASVRDLRVHRVEAPSAVVEKDSAVIRAIVTALDCDGMSTTAVLRHEGKEIDRKELHFEGARVDRRVQFTVSAEEIGWQEYELLLEPLDGESSEANNSAPVSWEVVQDKFRILLADDVSQWEYRYLQQLFRRDSHVEFDELLFSPRLRGTGEMATNPRLPTSVDDWAVYDVVILGDLRARHLGRESQEALAEYVRQGHGHLILIAGQNHLPAEYVGQPLMELLPVESTPGVVRAEAHTLALTEEGRLHSALAIEDSASASAASWKEVYQRNPIHHLSPFCRPKKTARTLIRAVPVGAAVVVDENTAREEQQAFLCWHQVGAGRVVYLAAPRTYLLRFRRSDRMHHRFWGQMLRWITAANLGSGSELVRLTTNQARYYVNEPVEITAWLKDRTGRPLSGQPLHASARALDQTVATILLEPDPDVAGRYFNTMEDLAPGAYKIVLGGSVVENLVQSDQETQQIHRMISIESHDDLEMLDTRCNRALLEQVAELTGGQILPPTAISEVFQLASLSPEVHETVRRVPLWNRWANLWLVLGCLFAEWIVRKQKGLV